jgi:hypothetical protein
MRVEATGPGSFAVEWEGLEDLRAEQGANLAAGGLLLRPAPPLAPFTTVVLALRIAGGGAVEARAQVVGAPAGALALHLEGDPAALLAALEAAAASPSGEEGAAPAEAGSLWERLRALTPPQKILLAPKADRVTRALLVQDSDPQVLFALLKNPRLSIDEVVRIAKSSFLSFQAAELILKTSPWMSNLDVRVALIQNAKTPVPFALRILPTLPDSEVRAIAKGAATSMALRQAAIKRITGG